MNASSSAARYHCDIAHGGQQADADTAGIPRVEPDGDAEPGQGYGESGSESECRVRTGGDVMCDGSRQE